MLKKPTLNPNSQELEHVVIELVKDDVRYMATEMRSMHREHLVVPVKIIFKSGETLSTFSRNISPAGVCLIGNQAIEENQIVNLEIHRMKGSPIIIMAEVRWCKPFGSECFMSGLKFMQVRRS